MRCDEPEKRQGTLPGRDREVMEVMDAEEWNHCRYMQRNLVSSKLLSAKKEKNHPKKVARKSQKLNGYMKFKSDEEGWWL